MHNWVIYFNTAGKGLFQIFNSLPLFPHAYMSLTWELCAFSTCTLKTENWLTLKRQWLLPFRPCYLCHKFPSDHPWLDCFILSFLSASHLIIYLSMFRSVSPELYSSYFKRHCWILVSKLCFFTYLGSRHCC